ncbi:MAG: PilZ domain-containing protein [Terriglobales bacterium]
MGVSENAQPAIRRSTRLPLEVPVQVTSLDPNFVFSERCNTTLVNAHGCGLISPRALEMNLPVRLEIISAKRHTTATVSEVVPLGGDPETWLIGLELHSPGNFWGIEYAPSDWAVEELIQEAPRSIHRPAPEPPSPHSPPRRWRLTDVSAGACYLESATPFPAGTPVLLSVRARDKEYLLDGVVRVSHPDTGMGIEFNGLQNDGQRVEDLIEHLAGTREAPRVFVGRKEKGPEKYNESRDQEHAALAPVRERGTPDLLLDLVVSGSGITQEQFFSDLRAQRLGKRRDPRIDVALPVLLTGVDTNGRPLSQRVMTVNISRRGALLEGIHGELKFGDKISLARSGQKEEFRVAWVRDADTPEGARIGVAAVDQNTKFWDSVLEELAQNQDAGAN